MPTKPEIIAFLKRDFPQNKCIVVEVGNASATVKHPIGTDELRPGGTVSGPVLMTVADVALYVAILGEIGIVPLTVTTSLTINFLRKPWACQPYLPAPLWPLLSSNGWARLIWFTSESARFEANKGGLSLLTVHFPVAVVKPSRGRNRISHCGFLRRTPLVASASRGFSGQ
jgi:hypothetical protein